MATLITLDPTASPLRRASIAGLQTAAVGDVIACRLVLSGDARSGAAGYSPVVAVGFPGVVLGFGENFVAATGGWDFTLRLDTEDLAESISAGGTLMMGVQVTITGPSGARVTEGFFDISIFRPVELPGDLIPIPGSIADELDARITALEETPPGSAAGVASFNGRTGAVTATKADVGLSNVDDTADSAKPVSAAQSAAIAAEASTRASVDASLSSRISTLETAPGCVGEVTEAELSAAVSAEASLRASADVVLSSAISVDVSSRISADTSLTSRISAEESVRASAVTSLTSRIGTEETARASVDASLASELGSEVTRATSFETALASRISAEETATSSLATRIGTEETARASADTSLASRISTEETATVSLTSRISTEESTRSSVAASLASRISTEESTRASADTSLAAAITGGGGGGMANPMTAAGDLIVGGSGGAPARVPAIALGATADTTCGAAFALCAGGPAWSQLDAPVMESRTSLATQGIQGSGSTALKYDATSDHPWAYSTLLGATVSSYAAVCLHPGSTRAAIVGSRFAALFQRLLATLSSLPTSGGGANPYTLCLLGMVGGQVAAGRNNSEVTLNVVVDTGELAIVHRTSGVDTVTLTGQYIVAGTPFLLDLIYDNVSGDVTAYKDGTGLGTVNVGPDKFSGTTQCSPRHSFMLRNASDTGVATSLFTHWAHSRMVTRNLFSSFVV